MVEGSFATIEIASLFVGDVPVTELLVVSLDDDVISKTISHKNP
jgi:hypothetical protein